MGSFLSANKYPSGNVAIFLNILHRGAKARIYTKFTIPEKQWDRKKSKIKGAAYNENERLKELVDTGSKVIDFYKYQFQKPTAKELKNKFFELILTDEKYTKIIDLARIYIEDNLPDKKGNTERERNPTKINHKQTINLIDAIGLNTSCESIDIRWYNDFLRITKPQELY